MAASPIYAELLGIEQTFRQEAALQRGEVKLALVPSLAQVEIPEILAKFRKEHPAIVLQLIDVDTNLSLQMLACGDVDLAIVSDAGDRSGIVSERLYKCCLVVPASHDLAQNPLVSLRNKW